VMIIQSESKVMKGEQRASLGNVFIVMVLPEREFLRAYRLSR
jgi:hypothetical protein